MTANAAKARWHATSMAGQAVMSPAGVADSPPRRSLASWLLRKLGPPPLPPRCYFYKSVYSVRPTAGLVSNRGLFSIAPTFDTIGPVARSAEDCSLLLDAIGASLED